MSGVYYQSLFSDKMLRKGESQHRVGRENPQQQHSRTSWIQTSGVDSQIIPQIEWACPPRFIANPNWKIEAGSETQEAHIQMQRESRIAEAIYHHYSDIPANPSVASDAFDINDDDSCVPIIPLAVINDETSLDGNDTDSIPLVTTQPLTAPPLGPQVNESPLIGTQPLAVPPLGPQVNERPPFAIQSLTVPPLGLQVNGRPPVASQPHTVPPLGPQVNGHLPVATQPLTVPLLGRQVNGRPPFAIQPLTVPPLGLPVNGRPPVATQPLTVPPLGPQVNGRPPIATQSLTIPLLGPQVNGRPPVATQPLTISPLVPQVNGRPPVATQSLTIPPLGQVDRRPPQALTVPPQGPQVNRRPPVGTQPLTVPRLGPQVNGRPPVAAQSLFVSSLGPQVNGRPPVATQSLTVPPLGPQVNGRPPIATQPLTVSPVGPQERPVIGTEPLLQRDEVIGTAVALVALIKSKEPGSQIDLELLIQLLRNPGMLERLRKEHGLTTNQSPVITSGQPQVPLEMRAARSQEGPGPKVTENTWSPSVPFARSISREVKDMIEQIHSKEIPVAPLTCLSSSSKFDSGKARNLINEYGDPMAAHSASGSSPLTTRSGSVAMKDTEYCRRLILQHGAAQEKPNLQGCVKTEGTRPRGACVYFNGVKGCRNGSSCWFKHVKVNVEGPSSSRAADEQEQCTKRVKGFGGKFW